LFFAKFDRVTTRFAHFEHDYSIIDSDCDIPAGELIRWGGAHNLPTFAALLRVPCNGPSFVKAVGCRGDDGIALGIEHDDGDRIPI
jgi:hypothetical protein